MKSLARGPARDAAVQLRARGQAGQWWQAGVSEVIQLETPELSERTC